MVSRQPHADVAILVLHGSDVGRETVFTSQRWPVRPVVEGRSGLPLGMLGVAPAWAGCGGHACSLRQPQGRMRIGGVPPVRGQPESLISPWQSRLRPSPANGLQDVCAGQISDAHHCQRTANITGHVRHQRRTRPQAAHERSIAAARLSPPAHTTTSPPGRSRRSGFPRERQVLRLLLS